MDEEAAVAVVAEILGEYAKRKKTLSCPEDALALLKLIKRVHETIAENSFYIVAEPKGEGNHIEDWMPLAYEEEDGPYLFASSTKEGATKHMGEKDQLLLVSGKECFRAFFEGKGTLKGILFDPDEDFYTITAAEFVEAYHKGHAYEEKWRKMEERLQANIKVKKASKA